MSVILRLMFVSLERRQKIFGNPGNLVHEIEIFQADGISPKNHAHASGSQPREAGDARYSGPVCDQIRPDFAVSCYLFSHLLPPKKQAFYYVYIGCCR